jgi:hypothetical protein
MRHELAYILGQMQCISQAGALASIVGDEAEDLLTRHEVCNYHLLPTIHYSDEYYVNYSSQQKH